MAVEFCFVTRLNLALLSVLLCITAPEAQIINSIEFKFMEEQEQGTYIGNVGAASRLTVTLSAIEFSRLKFNLPDSTNFRVDEKNGTLTSAARIDREKVCDGQVVCKIPNEVIVYTSVGGGSYDIFRVITVTVEILDMNDNFPEFPSRAVSLSVPENNDLDHVLRIRSAEDKDTGDNTVKQYSFKSTTDTFRLTVHRNPDGSSYLGIVVKEKLDREVKDFYQVTVVATDGGYPQRSGSVIINITVSDMNDNVPEFAQASYNETMRENMALRVPIMKVTATDKDIGRNAEISYQFSSRVTNKIRQTLYIDEQTGEIFAHSNVDYEEDKLFQFIVEAVDHGSPQYTSRTNVNLHVTDMNDNSPQIIINLPPMGTEVSEAEPEGKFIAHVLAVDADSGSNGDITCSMDDQHFSLTKFNDYTSNRFKITIAQALDFEQTASHKVSITCSDGGVPPLSNSTSFVVNVLDVNDNPPTFTEVIYYGRVLENQPGNEAVLQVLAHDWDSGNFGMLSYSMDDKYSSLFSIDSQSGLLKVLRTLDREYIPKYEFYVTVRDNGSDRLSSSALVIITVDDENDEPPRFLNQVYFGEVLENQPIGTVIGAASAVDLDSAENAKMLYSILQQGSDYVYFSINPDTGVIQTNSIFDREVKDEYHFLVKVEDPSRSLYFSTCNFTARILDANDHPPVIQSSFDENSTLFIQYSDPVGSLITNIVASDGDEQSSSTNSRHSGLTFIIQEGDPGQLFHLDHQTGSLTLARDITANDFRTYELVIVVQDGGSPPRVDSTHLSIKVNGTIPAFSEGGLSQHILIIIILVCITIVLVVITAVAIVLVKKFDRQRRRNRTEMKKSEDKLYHPDKSDILWDTSRENLNQKGRKNNRLQGSRASMLSNGSMIIPSPSDKQSNGPCSPPDEECRLIEMLRKNADDAGSESGEETDPSDSGRGGSEDEASHRAPGNDPENPTNKLYSQAHPRGAQSATDTKAKLYHQQHAPTSASKAQLTTSSKGKPLRHLDPSRRTTHSSVTSVVDSGISGGQSTLSLPGKSITGSVNNVTTGIYSTTGRPKRQIQPFQPGEQQPSWKKSDTSMNNRASKDTYRPILQSFQGQPTNPLQSVPSLTKGSTEGLAQHGPARTYVPPVRTFKYTDRTYPLSNNRNSASFPEEDENTTKSGGHKVNHEELKPEREKVAIRDTVV